MRNSVGESIIFCLIGIFPLCGSVLAQERAQDRRTWIDENTSTSDDLRRIPVAPGQRGPEGTLVMIGGLIFDGTGAGVRNGAIIIERNKIKEILPPASPSVPGDAQVIDVNGKLSCG